MFHGIKREAHFLFDWENLTISQTFMKYKAHVSQNRKVYHTHQDDDWKRGSKANMGIEKQIPQIDPILKVYVTEFERRNGDFLSEFIL